MGTDADPGNEWENGKKMATRPFSDLTVNPRHLHED